VICDFFERFLKGWFWMFGLASSSLQCNCSRVFDGGTSLRVQNEFLRWMPLRTSPPAPFALWLVACTTAQGPVGTDAIVVLKSGSWPNGARAVARLREVLAEHKISLSIRIQDITIEEEAVRHRYLGSPSIRIHGLDIDPEARAFDDYGLGWRRYPDAGGVPTKAMMLEALREAELIDWSLMNTDIHDAQDDKSWISCPSVLKQSSENPLGEHWFSLNRLRVFNPKLRLQGCPQIVGVAPRRVGVVERGEG
jgi:hypothetical protein